MASNYRTNYDVDIVFCIDCTESMDNILNIIKDKALALYSDIILAMEEKSKTIGQLRARVVAFRDYVAYDDEKKKNAHLNEPMLTTKFFNLRYESEKLEISVKSLQPAGGGDEPEDGLEALAYAIRSDWAVNKENKSRHIIVLWTDQRPHNLGYAKGSSKYPTGMAQSFDELTEWWGDRDAPGYMPNQNAKRLVLFAPYEGEWAAITENWDQVIHYPSKAGNNLNEINYSKIIDAIRNSIQL